ncbi:beta-ketoacyl-ACP synthase II [Ostreibacterium oceani]|uniref:3-oxoacyl-[acyl-carrier-protein] synthase 2 n=1 Tax=Ostreibacterium oceani TaxID=2654998 RepID=A0A6N7EWD2_9GAMM|nr:beta-ketoacyl-ACP synthase II [Ostreibacterium oceani]
MMKKRVVITGLGAVTPLANSVPATWSGLLNGQSGIATIASYDPSDLSVQFCGEVKNFDATGIIDAKEIRKMDLFIQYALVAAHEAVQDSGYIVNDENSERAGVIIGAGIGGLPGIVEGYQTFVDKGARRVSPFYVPRSIINMAAGHVSMAYGIKGPSLSTVTACTSGTHSIGQAFRMIQYGEVDMMLAGGAEMSSCAMGIAGFAAARALSTRNDNPAAASRPWDKDRDGFVLSDAAGIIMLEELETAKARGANIYAELVGFGMSSDAYHITTPPENGDGARRAMANAVKDASIDVQSVDYINAHGTSTPLGDRAEFLAVKQLFNGETSQLKMSSTKSMTGHALGAAGAIEAIFTTLAVNHNVAPPTINLDSPEPDFDIDLVANTAKDSQINYALSNSFGFGGTNGSLLIKKFSD